MSITYLVGAVRSEIMVDHDTQILSEEDWGVEMEPQAGAEGGRIIASGTPEEIAGNRESISEKFQTVISIKLFSTATMQLS